MSLLIQSTCNILNNATVRFILFSTDKNCVRTEICNHSARHSFCLNEVWSPETIFLNFVTHLRTKNNLRVDCNVTLIRTKGAQSLMRYLVSLIFLWTGEELYLHSVYHPPDACRNESWNLWWIRSHRETKSWWTSSRCNEDASNAHNSAFMIFPQLPWQQLRITSLARIPTFVMSFMVIIKSSFLGNLKRRWIRSTSFLSSFRISMGSDMNQTDICYRQHFFLRRLLSQQWWDVQELCIFCLLSCCWQSSQASQLTSGSPTISAPAWLW